MEGVIKYLGWQVAADGWCERNVVHRMNEGYRAWGEMKSVLSNRGLGIKAKKCLYEGVIVPTVLCGADAWGMRSAERRKVNVLEMNSLKQFYFHKTWCRIYNLHWNIIHKSTGVTWNVGPYKLIRLPGHPNLDLNLT